MVMSARLFFASPLEMLIAKVCGVEDSMIVFV